MVKLKTNKTLTKEKTKKNTKIKTKMIEFEKRITTRTIVYLSGQKREMKGKKVTGDKPVTSGHHVSFHMENETVRNNMR